MVTVVSISEAEITLSQLVKRAAAGETIVIGTYGQPCAKLVGIDDVRPAKKKIFGAMKGEFEVPDDFDAALPEDLLDAFHGE